MRTLVACLLLLAAPARAEELQIRPGVDLPITLGLGVVGLTLEYAVTPTLPAPSFAPGGEDRLTALDRVALRWSPGAALASDLILYPMLLVPFGVHILDHAGGPLDRWSQEALVTTEAFFLNLVATQILKFAVRRPRPLVWLDPRQVADPEDRAALVEAQGEPDAGLSFPSGHASSTFLVASCTLTLLLLEHGRSRPGLMTLAALLLGGAATTTGVLRVVAGKHHPTDVWAGAALGTAIGVLVPMLHRSPLRLGASGTPLGGPALALYGPLP